MKRVIAPALAALALLACDAIQPSLNVKVKAVLPCDQPGALENVTVMQVRTLDSAGGEKSTSVNKSSNKASLANLAVEDGTTVFMTGFEDQNGLLDNVPLATGASAPINLKAFVAENVFPGPRQYPKDTEAEVIVPMGKVYSFGSTTDPSKGSGASSCSVLAQGRHGHTATFLPSIGKVLILGGLTYASDGAETFVPRDRAVEYYDPATGAFEAVELHANVAPLMQRAFHTATLMPSGEVLVWGGVGPEGTAGNVTPRAVSFIYRPDQDGEARVKQLLATQGFQIKRFHHQATLTANGLRVVITGGCGGIGGLSPADIKAGKCPKKSDACMEGSCRPAQVDLFDVTDGRATLLSTPLANPRAFHTATATENELVVIAGGDDGDGLVPAVELYSVLPGGARGILTPATDTLGSAAVTHASAVALPSADCARLLPTHTVNQCVLLTGGCNALLNAAGECPAANLQSVSTILDFGAVAGMRAQQGPALYRKRIDHKAFFLPGSGANMVLLAGGRFETTMADTIPASAELLPREAMPQPFRPAPAPFMKNARSRFATAVFPNGGLLFTGGVPSVTPAMPTSLATAELFFFPVK